MGGEQVGLQRDKALEVRTERTRVAQTEVKQLIHSFLLMMWVKYITQSVSHGKFCFSYKLYRSEQ